MRGHAGGDGGVAGPLGGAAEGPGHAGAAASGWMARGLGRSMAGAPGTHGAGEGGRPAGQASHARAGAGGGSGRAGRGRARAQWRGGARGPAGQPCCGDRLFASFEEGREDQEAIKPALEGGSEATEMAGMFIDPAAMHNIDIGELRICLSAPLACAWNNLALNPRVCPSAVARLCTNLRWFAQLTNSKADLLRLSLPRKAMVSLLRFRTGCHALPNGIDTRTGVPRSQRLCPLCQSPYSDERHTLLECTASRPLREKYQQLFCPPVSMRQCIWQNDLPQLARFVIECLKFMAAAQFTS